MGTIYEHAYLTIAASWPSNSTGGLFSNESTKYRPKNIGIANLYIRGIPRGHCEVVLGDTEDASPLTGRREVRKHWPLLTRAWVYQERQLSARMIHFGRDELLWECHSGQCSEEHPRMLLDTEHNGSSRALRSRSNDPAIAWPWAVTQYSRLDITYQSDRLPALAAIVERMMRQRLDSQYVAGMWTDSIIADLAWHHHHDDDGYSLPRPQQYAPSWSWASTQGPVRFSAYTPCVDLLGLDFKSTGPPQLGGVVNARLRLKGPVFTTRFPKYISEVRKTLSQSPGLEIFLGMQDFEYKAYDKFENSTIPVTVLIIGGRGEQRLLAMLLHKIGNDWERIGLAWIRCPWTAVYVSKERLQEFLDSLPIEEISII